MDERAHQGRTGRRRCARGGARGRARLHRRLALAAGLAGALVVTTSPPVAAGGGDFLEPARDRYEPGQTVTMIGYGVSYADPEATWRREPYYGYLRAGDPDPAAPFPGRAGAFPGLRVGTVTVQEVPPDDGRDLRVSIEFSLPDDLPPGAYLVGVCTDGCARDLGWFLPSEMWVGIDPPYAVVRDWPLTDPAIRWLEPDALLSGPDGPVTAADVRAGRVPPAPSEAVATPQPLPEVTASPVTSQPAHGAERGAPAGVRPDTAGAEADLVASDAPGDGRARDGTPVPVSWIVAGGATLLAGGAALRSRSRRRPRGGDDGAARGAGDGDHGGGARAAASGGGDDAADEMDVELRAITGDDEHAIGRTRHRVRL